MTLTLLPAATANAMMQAAVAPATTVYNSLHTATTSNTGASEVTGGSYGRQTIQYGSAASGVMTSTTAQNFTSMPSCTVSYGGIWTAVTAGTFTLGFALGSSYTVPAGATVAFAIGAQTLTQSG